MSTPRVIRALWCAVLWLGGCATPEVCLTGDEAVCDGGVVRPDFCNSQQEADSDPVHCQLTPGTRLTCVDDAGVVRPDCYAYLSVTTDGGPDRDWYLARMPAGLTARSLLHVNAGYQVTQTPVNFAVNVLTPGPDGGLTSVITGVDVHGAAAPRPVDLVVPFGQSSARVYVLVSDQNTGVVHTDYRNPYSVLAEVVENPDPHEPNDLADAGTVIALSGASGAQAGTSFGYLATDNDVDRFVFSVAAPGQIIYLRLTGPDPQLSNPPPGFGRLAYTLLDPLGGPIAEGVMDTEFLPIDLATARLAPRAGLYTLVVQGYRAANSTSAVKGDLRLRYDVDVRVLTDLDPLEPNDSYAQAKLKETRLGGLGTTILQGRLSYVQDEEWFGFVLPARTSPSTFRYRLGDAPDGGRFPPLTPLSTRQVRVMQPVTAGANATVRQLACQTSAAACPKGYTSPSSPDRLLVEALCASQDPPLCLYAERDEDQNFPGLKNEVGAIPVDPGQDTTVYLMFRDQGLGRAKYADDREWTLTLDWVDDPDRAGRLAGPTLATLGTSPVSSAGQLTFGYGQYLAPFDLTAGVGIRALNDYDAFETDKDLWQFDLGGVSGDQSWSVSWDLAHGDGGIVPGDLALEVTTCGNPGGSDAGLCPGAQTVIFAYSAASLSPWYRPSSASYATQLFTRTDTATTTTITALPIGCECFSASRALGGRIYINVAAINRLSNEPLSYTLRQSLTPYSCPPADGGACGFAP